MTDHSPTSSIAASCNALDKFRRNKGWNFTDLADQLGVVPWTATRYCRPLDDPEYRQPRAEQMRKISEITNGSVDAGMMLPAPDRGRKRASLAPDT